MSAYAQPCFDHEYIQSDCPDCGKLSSENGNIASDDKLDLNIQNLLLSQENQRLEAEVKRLKATLAPHLKQEEAIRAAREKMRQEIAEERGSLTEAQAARRAARFEQ